MLALNTMKKKSERFEQKEKLQQAALTKYLVYIWHHLYPRDLSHNNR